MIKTDLCKKKKIQNLNKLITSKEEEHPPPSQKKHHDQIGFTGVFYQRFKGELGTPG